MLSLNSTVALGRFLKLSSLVSFFLDKDKVELPYAYAYMLYKIKGERKKKKKNFNLEHVLSIVRIIEVLLLLSFKIIFRWKINYLGCFL